ncbi:MAG TPA: ATP-binding protein [Woeseiaceae bacterium]|nr:ATP-binding protein [Woeseiaceae bacterium]
MIARIIVSVAITLAVGAGTVALWQNLEEQRLNQVARVAEAESYAARSQLVRDMDRLLSALRNVAIMLSTYGHLPGQQWVPHTGTELAEFAGIELLLWDDPDRGVRYARAGDNDRFDYRPRDEEWQAYVDLLGRARMVERTAMLGPNFRENGGVYYEVVLIDPDRRSNARVVAVVNIGETIADFLFDQSPGFAIRVESEDVLLYERDTPVQPAPEKWSRSGKIRLSAGNLWTITHQPTTSMLESFDTPSLELVLLLGLLIAVLMGMLTFENGRATSRANAAEIAESKLEKLNRGLEAVVRKRTGELAERTSDLQTLTDSVAHDLRNPLNSMAVNIQLLEAKFAEPLGEEGRRILQRLLPAIRQMADILERLLGLSILANSTFNPKPLNMEKLVRETFEDLRASEHSPARFDIDPLPPAYADRTLVQMLLTNLLGNALKYTRDRRERRIRVSAETSNGETVYSIADNGIGFDADSGERIFAAFQQLNTGSRADGVGLGLTLVKKVVDRHGGRIWATSQPGNGATFYFTLEPRTDRTSVEEG